MDEKAKVLEEYVKFKRLSVTSEKINDISNYAKFFIYFKKKKLSDYTETDLLDYFTEISPKYSQWTMNLIKAYTKNFIKWHFVDWSSRFRNLNAICRTETPPETYEASDMINETDFEKLIKAEESVFWKAFFLTQFYGGCRPQEVCLLTWDKVEFDNEGGAFITIFSNKNKKSFIKYVPEKAAFYLKQLKGLDSKYVFINTKTKRPITRRGALVILKKLSKKVFGKSIDLYTLRHSIATIIYNKDDIKDDDIAKQMGHTKSMKGRYVHNDRDKLKAHAKRIYLEPENLPPEKKVEYEKRIADLEDSIMLIKNILGQQILTRNKIKPTDKNIQELFSNINKVQSS